MLKVHGTVYRTAAQMQRRVEQIERVNAEIGASDGRVTETNALVAAIETLRERERDADYRRHAADQVRIAQRELDNATDEDREAVGWDIHRLQYEDIDTGRMHVRRYETHVGFLRALIRVYGNPSKYSVINAD